jgi:hypothetical protein
LKDNTLRQIDSRIVIASSFFYFGIIVGIPVPVLASYCEMGRIGKL